MKPRTIFLLIIPLIVVLLCPFPCVVSPVSVIRVADASGAPVSGVRVYRSWEHFGTGQRGDETKDTDGSGVATFEKHSVSFMPLGRLFGFAAALISPHASTGSMTSFEIYCPTGYIETTKQGEQHVYIDHSPPPPQSTIEYSARVCLTYRQTSPIEFTLPVRKLK